MKRENCHNIRDAFRYLKSLKLKGGFYKLDYKDYLDINNDFLDFLIKEILDLGSITLPQKMGKIYVKALESKSIEQYPIDFNLTKSMFKSTGENKKYYHLNMHTNGNIYFFRWSTSGMIAKNKILYKFKSGKFLRDSLKESIHKGLNVKVVNTIK